MSYNSVYSKLLKIMDCDSWALEAVGQVFDQALVKSQDDDEAEEDDKEEEEDEEEEEEEVVEDEDEDEEEEETVTCPIPTSLRGTARKRPSSAGLARPRLRQKGPGPCTVEEASASACQVPAAMAGTFPVSAVAGLDVAPGTGDTWLPWWVAEQSVMSPKRVADIFAAQYRINAEVLAEGSCGMARTIQRQFDNKIFICKTMKHVNSFSTVVQFQQEVLLLNNFRHQHSRVGGCFRHQQQAPGVPHHS